MTCLVRFLKLSGVLFLGALVVLFLQFNGFAMQFAESWRSGTGWIVFLTLTAVEIGAFIALFLAWYPRKSKLILRANPTQEQLDAFAREMRSRLRENKFVREKHIDVNDPDFTKKALDVLDAKADELIRSDSRKIFLGTALSQNGRLDALIVFIAMTRMVWRISKLYNQRPTPSEILSVYSTVSTSAFVAFSIDALNIPGMVTETMNSLVPAVAPHMASISMPVMGNIMHVFTSSMLDGAANGLMALRAGILTKNAFRYASLDQQVSRSMSTNEITSAMLSLSKECLGDITLGLKDQFVGVAAGMAGSCVEKTRDAVQGVASAVTGTVTFAGGMIARGGEAVASTVSTGVKSAVSTVGDTVSSAGSAVVRGGETVASTVSTGVKSAVSTVGDTVSSAGSAVVRGGEAVATTVSTGVKSAVSAVGDTVSSAGSAVVRGGDAVVQAVGSGVSAVGSGVSATAGAVGSVTASVVKSTVRTVERGVSSTAAAADSVVKGGAAVAGSVVRGGTAVVTSGIDATRKLVHGAGSFLGRCIPGKKKS